VTGLSHLGVSSLLSYVIAVLLPAFDALIPVLPSETAVIALGVATAGSADPRAAVLVALAACGAFLGDNAAYLLGRRFGPAAGRRVFAGVRGARRRAWAERSLHRFGARMIIGCRFIPGGRTAIMLTCGLVGYPRRRFAAATAVAAVIWASYAFLIGRLGGKAFEDQPWLGLLLALGVTVVISVAIEVARRAWAWHMGRRRRSSAAFTRSAHRLRQACTRPGCAEGSPRPVAAEDNHHIGAVHAAANATAHPGRNAVAE
jgi:membrane protein DedA with SNARE-associated domain